MKLYLVSDLHLEGRNFQPPMDADAANVILLPGDIWKGDAGIHWARATWPDHEIVYVAGNHEFYGRNRKVVLASLRIAARETGVHFLDNEEVVIEGVRFLGSILWTDFRLFGEELRQECMARAAVALSDFRVIHEGVRHFSPMDSVVLHETAVKWLEMKLKREPFDGKTVVVTHHAPSWGSVVPRFQHDLISACFASRLDHLLGFSEVWIHGHMHDSLDYVQDGTRLVCNPRGYGRSGGGDENWDFNPGLILEL